MPQFVPVFLIALASLLALYLGFVIQENGFESPTGFVAVNSPANKIAQPKTLTPPIQFQPVKMSDLIFLGDVQEIRAGEPEVLVEFSDFVENKEELGQKKIDFSSEKEYDQIFLKFDISETNGYGEFAIFVNNEEVYRGSPKVGMQEFQIFKDILKSENQLRVEAVGGFLFTPAKYSFEAKLIGITGTHAEYQFSTRDTGERKMAASVRGSGSFRMVLNEREIFSGGASDFVSVDVPAGFVSGKNILLVFPDPNSELTVDFVEFLK